MQHFGLQNDYLFLAFNYQQVWAAYFIENYPYNYYKIFCFPVPLTSLKFHSLLPLIGRKTAASYRELEARRSRVADLEKIYMDMAMQKELQVLNLILVLMWLSGCAWNTSFNYKLH